MGRGGEAGVGGWKRDKGIRDLFVRVVEEDDTFAPPRQASLEQSLCHSFVAQARDESARVNQSMEAGFSVCHAMKQGVNCHDQSAIQSMKPWPPPSMNEDRADGYAISSKPRSPPRRVGSITLQGTRADSSPNPA